MLVGRDEECKRIADVLAAARHERSGALVLSGEPGIGKSALCAWAVDHADDMRVLAVRGVESEVDVPFAGLSELCSGEVDRLDALPRPQARALEAALALRDVRPGDRFAVGAATLSLLGAVAEPRPALVLIDDAQWLDVSSAAALLFAARRLRTEGVALLVATRPGTMFDAERNGLSRIVLSGLDRQASRTLLAAAHDRLDSGVAQRLVDRAQGNPLALLELPHVLSDEQLTGDTPLEEPMPLGPTLARALMHRLSSLSDETRRALLAAAASGGERIQPVVEALRRLALDRSVLEDAEQAGALSIAGERFEFRHPLLRSAIYHDATGPARRAAHAAAGTGHGR